MLFSWLTRLIFPLESHLQVSIFDQTGHPRLEHLEERVVLTTF